MGRGVYHRLGGQRAAPVGAALAGLGTLAVLTAVTGGALNVGLNLRAIQFVIGVLMLLFGSRWLAKAVARQAGLKALRDKDVEFAQIRVQVSGGAGRRRGLSRPRACCWRG
jgi:uncharacterized membrane protein